MAERLTREHLSKKYPDQSIGITNIKYENNDGVTIESAEVVYTPEDKTPEELLTLQVSGEEDIMCWYTTGSRVNVGVMTLC